MNAQSIIEDALADGLVMTVTSTDKLHVEGEHDKLERWRPVLAEYKPLVIAALSKQIKQAILSLSAGNLHRDFELRLKTMALRWRYSPGEAAELLALAAVDPYGWLLAVNLDERKFGNDDTVVVH